MKVFLAANSLLPAYGGPAYSVSRLAIALAQTGIEVGIWASDQSAETTVLLPGSVSVRRLTGTESEALKSFGKPHVLHDNGIWMPHHHCYARLAAERGIPRVVSTRGMLEPWALNHKRWKKRIGWWLYQRRDLQCAARHHVTAEAEAHNVRRLGFAVPISVIPNGVDVPEAPPRTLPVITPSRDLEETRTALFLGRLYPVKGLPMLVEAWARARPQGWRLLIAGPDEAGHKQKIEQAVAAAGLRSVISFLGPLDEEAKRSAYLDADLFVLPTHSENFGMAIGEALAHGLPVLTTTGAPWPMLHTHRCGWWVDPTVDGIANGLREATSLDAITLRTMGARGREFVAAGLGWDGVGKKFAALYEAIRS